MVNLHSTRAHNYSRVIVSSKFNNTRATVVQASFSSDEHAVNNFSTRSCSDGVGGRERQYSKPRRMRAALDCSSFNNLSARACANSTCARSFKSVSDWRGVFDRARRVQALKASGASKTLRLGCGVARQKNV